MHFHGKYIALREACRIAESWNISGRHAIVIARVHFGSDLRAADMQITVSTL
jgi:hypothetical protein